MSKSGSSLQRQKVYSSTEVEGCYLDLMPRRQWKKWKNLGHVLETQLVSQGRTSRGTQTNWHWVTMASRWRHAVLLKTREVETDTGSEVTSSSFKSVTGVPELKELRKVRSCDKITDTQDLDYDPYSLAAPYTRKSSSCQAKYLPPSMKETVKAYGRIWKSFASLSPFKAYSKRHRKPPFQSGQVSTLSFSSPRASEPRSSPLQPLIKVPGAMKGGYRAGPYRIK